MKCKLCEGSLEKLGRLAALDHYKCRNCGAQFSKRIKVKVSKWDIDFDVTEKRK